MSQKSRRPSSGARSRPSRGGRSWRWLWTLLAAGLIVGAAVPASSYDSASLDRSSAIGVVQDTDGLLGIDHSTSVAKPSDTLVGVTNRFGEERTITVALQSCQENDLSLAASGSTDGTLVSNDGSSVTFTLPAGGSQDVTISLNDVQCDPIVTRIETTDGLTQVTAERETSPEQGGNGNGNGNSNGNGNGNNPNVVAGVF